MDVKISLFVDKKGRKVCKLENGKIVLHLILKKDYSDVKFKLRNERILEDIEEMLVPAFETEVFKDLVDSSGLLYVDKISD